MILSINSLLAKGRKSMIPKISKKINKSRSRNRIRQKIFFTNVECPSCSSSVAYIAWHRDYATGYCPDCNEEWLES